MQPLQRRLGPILVLVLALNGCSNPFTSRDVTRNSTYHVGFVPGEVYRLKVDMALVESRSDDGKRSFVYPHPQGGPWVSVVKPGTYLLDTPERGGSSIVAMIPAGSKVQVSRLRYESYMLLDFCPEAMVTAYGRLLDTPYSESDVALTFVSQFVDVPKAPLDQTAAHAPNDALIERLVE